MAKRKTVRRIKTGLASIQGRLLTSYEACCYHFQHELDQKHYNEVMKPYIKETFKKDSKFIFQLPDWKWSMYSRWACAVYWYTKRIHFEMDDITKELVITEINSVNNQLKDLVEEGKQIESEKTEQKKETVTISPLDRLRDKVNRTVLLEVDELWDSWIDNKPSDLNMYESFKRHGLTGKAVQFVTPTIQEDLQLYYDCNNKSDPQAVEALSHIDSKERKRRIKVYEQMLNDLDRIQAQTTLNRVPRKPKVRTADKQITKLNYKKNDKEYKLESVNPLLVVGAHRVYTFNTKTRVLSVYKTNSTSGIQVKGTSLDNVDLRLSQCMKLRKPNDVLPVILGRADKTIDKTLEELSVKKSTPSTRINNDTILLRAV